MNVLSLFDGMSCGQIALNRLGIKYNKYFASEIDKYAISITQRNYPNTIQLGDVTKVKGKNLPKIDLLIGGSPCQGFSMAGKRLNFNDHRSKLFFEYIRLLKELKPKYFLLENVKMKKNSEDVITKFLGVKPVKINSSLFSAQHRVRLYWTNIPIKLNELPLPNIKDTVNSIIEENRHTKYNIMTDYRFFEKSAPVISKFGLIYLGGVLKAVNKFWLDNGKILSRNFSQGQRVYSTDGKSVTLNAHGGGLGAKTGLYEIGGLFSKLTPMECERLQTVPDNYTDGISDNQRYTMLGNGWTVDVIAWILSYAKYYSKQLDLFTDTKTNSNKQLELFD